MAEPQRPRQPYSYTGQQPPYGAPAPRRLSRGRQRGPLFWLLLFAGLVAVLAVVGWWASGTRMFMRHEPLSTTQLVFYEITGSAATASLTATTPTGSTQYAEQSVPTTLRYLMEPGSFVYVSAQNDGADGDVTCAIRVGATVVSQNTASGGYSIAVCKGSVPSAP